MASLLVVDDDRDVCRLMSLLLSCEGHAATCFVDGCEALRFLRGTKPNLVLLDVMMPGIDGLQVLREIRTDPHFDDMPVVMYTALIGGEARAQADRLGANGYIVKGTAWPTVYAQIEAHLQAPDVNMN